MEGLPVSYSLNSGDNGNNWWGDFIAGLLRIARGKIAQLEAFQFNTALAAGNAQQTRNEMQGQTALILAALRDRTSSSSGGAAA